ncbi:MAG: DUF302 domain-containing protein [Thiobacillaceae bacterium]
MKKNLLLICLLGMIAGVAQASDNFTALFKTHGKFADVRDMLVSTIEGRGLKINHANYIADMLERTGKDLGATKQVYANGEQFEFCSAIISRRMMEADPHAIVMCPYIISVYTIPNDGDTVYLAYRKPAVGSNKALKKALADVDSLLSSIIKEAIE